MDLSPRRFKAQVELALTNQRLQQALSNVPRGFQEKRRKARAALPEFDALRQEGKEIRNHTIAHLDHYLERFTEAAEANGTQVHWASTGEEARAIILDLCQGARTVTKGKSMATEEIHLNAALEAAGIVPVETDLGEYIIQLRKEPPSHIIAPAIHLTAQDVRETFQKAHAGLAGDRDLSLAAHLVAEARTMLRDRFLAADVGITGANFLIAETGSGIIVTNEGNGDLTQILPRKHIVVASLEKLVPTLNDAMTLIRLLARSATGQEMSVYTTLFTGPRRPGDLDGPEEMHVVLLDNGRSALPGTEMQEVLRCIRCAACINHCPVYAAVGGHAYGSTYPGPIGAALNPALIGAPEAQHHYQASSFCGRCEEVCPMQIPLPKIMRHWREVAHQSRTTPAVQRWALAAWAALATRPWAYRQAMGLAVRALALMGRGKGRLRWLPLARGWTRHRDLPVPSAGGSFQTRYAAQMRARR